MLVISTTKIINKTDFAHQKPSKKHALVNSRAFFEYSHPTFKGATKEVNLHLPVKKIEKLFKKAIEKIKLENDIISKTKIAHEYIDIFRDDLMSHKRFKKIQNNSNQELFFEDRSHKVLNPMAELMNKISDIDMDVYLTKPIRFSKEEFNEFFETYLKISLKSIQQYEIFLNKGLDGNSFNPAKIFKMALESIQEETSLKNINVKVDNEKIFEKPFQKGKLEIYGLANHLIYEVFSNILQNAAKYSPKNSQTIIKFKKQKINNNNFLVFSVADKGIGIPKKEQKKVLEGNRASNAISSGIQGTGYGLNRVYKILTRMNGDLKIKSPLNIENKEFPGTKISCYIPLKD